MGKKKTEPEGLEEARTCAAWGLMLWEQAAKALDADQGKGFAAKHPEALAMCVQAGSAMRVSRSLDRLGRVLTGLE